MILCILLLSACSKSNKKSDTSTKDEEYHIDDDTIPSDNDFNLEVRGKSK